MNHGWDGIMDCLVGRLLFPEFEELAGLLTVGYMYCSKEMTQASQKKYSMELLSNLETKTWLIASGHRYLSLLHHRTSSTDKVSTISAAIDHRP